jgi:hypothetical protein
MQISLRHIISILTLPNMIYLKVKKDFFEADEIDLYNLHIYKDYVPLPYIKQATIYDAFLDSRFLNSEKELLHKQDNFEASFRRFVDCNKKYDHILFNQYIQYEIEYLKPIAIEWCKNNKVQYVDDI